MAATLQDQASPTDFEPDDPTARHGLTDLGNAERLVAKNGHNLRFCHEWGEWLVWNGKRWMRDDTAAVHRLAKNTILGLYEGLDREASREARKARFEWACLSESKGRLEAMVSLAAREPGVPINVADLDADPWLFNCQNGTIDLRTGARRDHRREDHLAAICPVDYDERAGCPVWLETITAVFSGDAELIGFFQRLCGLALTGDVSEQILPILYGKGSNGKSTLMNALLAVFGTDYAMKAPPELLLARKGERHPTELSDLFGKRLVVAIETGEFARMNEPLVKELTGSDKIRARRMRQDFWEFHPTHKIMLCTNHKPLVKGTDHGIWRRLKLVPFEMTFPETQEGKAIPKRLLDELPGILAWCVRGCLEWQDRGLEPPAKVAEATARYRQDEDFLTEFLKDICVTGPNSKVKATSLYEAYKSYSEQLGEHPASQRKFGESMAERGYMRFTSNGTWYRGVAMSRVIGS